MKGGREIGSSCDNCDLNVSSPSGMRKTHVMVIEGQQQQNTPMNDHQAEDDKNEGQQQQKEIMEQEKNITSTDDHDQDERDADTYVIP